MRKKWSVTAIALVLTVVGTSCMTQTGGNWVPPMETWTAGDSIMAGSLQPPSWVDGLNTPVFNTAQSGRGFSSGPTGTIEAVLDYWIDLYGAPDRVLISGGANDQLTGASAASTTAAMAHLENWLGSLGTEVVWITAPKMTTPTPVLDQTNAWMRSRPRVIDCAPATGEPLLNPAYALDNVHLNDAGDTKITNCVLASPFA